MKKKKSRREMESDRPEKSRKMPEKERGTLYGVNGEGGVGTPHPKTSMGGEAEICKKVGKKRGSKGNIHRFRQERKRRRSRIASHRKKGKKRKM